MCSSRALSSPAICVTGMPVSMATTSATSSAVRRERPVSGFQWLR